MTGHKTTDVVLKHYFRPGQEDFRLALEGAMPKLLTTGQQTDKHQEIKAEVVVPGKTARDEMRELLGKVKRKGLREELLGLLAKV